MIKIIKKKKTLYQQLKIYFGKFSGSPNRHECLETRKVPGQPLISHY